MPSIAVITAILLPMILLDVALGMFLYVLDKRRPGNQLFAVYMAALAAWTMTILGFYLSRSPQEALQWMRAAYVEAILAVVSFWYFSTVFPVYRKHSTVVHVSLVSTLVALGYAIMATDFIVVSVSQQPWWRHVQLNAMGWYGYAPFLVFFFLLGHYNLIRSYRESVGQLRKQLFSIIVSVFFGVEIGGVVCNLLLPSPIFRNWTWIWLGPTLSTLIVVPFMAWAIYRHRLFTVRTMVTQLLIGYTMIIAIVDLLLSRELIDIAVRSVLVAAVVAFGVMLIRRTNEEDRQREKLLSMTEELSAANIRLQELDQLKTEFVSIAAHQLRTPITIMKGYLSLMMENAYGPTPPSLQEKIGHMFQMNERLVLMVNNMLNVTRMERNVIEYAVERTDVAAIARECVAEMQLKARQKGLTAEYAGGEGAVMAFADREKLHEVLSNLLDNAVKYSPAGTITCDVRTWRNGQEVLLSVHDQGAGVKPDQTDALFKKFSRADSHKTSAEAGTGLGLYVCKQFTEGMGGRIWVDRSEMGKGMTFALTIPTEPARVCEKPETIPVTTAA